MFSVIHTASAVMTLGFYVGALIYSLSRKSDRTAAKSLVVTGLLIMLLMHLGTYGFSFWINRSGVLNQGLAVSLFTMVSSLGFVIAMGMIVVAVFVKRPPAQYEGDRGEERQLVVSDNPYSPPAN